MAYTLYTQSFGGGFANTMVLIKEVGTDLPATILTAPTGALVNVFGLAQLNGAGNLSVYIDTARTWTVISFDGTDITPAAELSVPERTIVKDCVTAGLTSAMISGIAGLASAIT